jgi:hypothetical protein
MSDTMNSARKEKVAKACVSSAMAQWGAGWVLLSKKQKDAFVAAALLDNLLVMDEAAMSPDMQRFRALADRALGMIDDPSVKFDGPGTKSEAGIVRVRSR